MLFNLVDRLNFHNLFVIITFHCLVPKIEEEFVY